MVSEAHGLITDLLLGEGTLSRETHQKLRMIKEILAPRFEKTPAHPHIIFGECGEMTDEQETCPILSCTILDHLALT